MEDEIKQQISFKGTKDKSEKKKKSNKSKNNIATNEEILKYCMDNNLIYALMLWLEVDLGVPVVRSGIIKKYKTALGTNGYYFVSLDPNKKSLIKDMFISNEEYEEYIQTLFNELSMYLTESENKKSSAKFMFGRYVYCKLNKIKMGDIDLLVFAQHLKYIKFKVDEK